MAPVSNTTKSSLARSHDCRYAAVGTDSQELGLFLIAFAQVDLMDVVRQPYLFEEYGHFPAISALMPSKGQSGANSSVISLLGRIGVAPISWLCVPADHNDSGTTGQERSHKFLDSWQ